MFGFAENVMGLTHRLCETQNSSHDHCIAKFNSVMDACALTLHMDPNMNGFPMRRPRIYMPLFYRTWLKKLSITDEDAKIGMTDLVQRFCGRKQMPLQSFLLPEDRPIIVTVVDGQGLLEERCLLGCRRLRLSRSQPQPGLFVEESGQEGQT